LIFLLCCVLQYFACASYGLLVSVLIKDFEIAAALAPIVFLPLLLLSGFMVNTDQIPYVFKPLEYLSPFKYCFNSLIQNEYRNIDGLNYNGDPMENYNFALDI